jgi:hypothetical protein
MTSRNLGLALLASLFIVRLQSATAQGDQSFSGRVYDLDLFGREGWT